jgi:AcrR family transcriptional regulator
MPQPNALHAPLRGRHDKAGRQRALIEAAIQLFSEYGYAAATTRAIAERAGVSEGLIHRYFGGKHGLLLAAFASRQNDVARDFLGATRAHGSLEDEVEWLLTWPLDVMWEKQDFMRIATSQAILDPEMGRFVGEQINGSRVRLIVDRLEVHRTAGRIPADADIEALASAIAGYTFAAGFFSQVVFGLDRDMVRKQAQAMARMLCGGILIQSPFRKDTSDA